MEHLPSPCHQVLETGLTRCCTGRFEENNVREMHIVQAWPMRFQKETETISEARMGPLM